LEVSRLWKWQRTVVDSMPVRGQTTEEVEAMKEHRWTTGDGVEHVAYQCEECLRWFDSPSPHLPSHAPDSRARIEGEQ
jgi:hypothetical protein